MASMYSAKVMEHFANPHNVGEIHDANGVGEVGNPKCGDIMRMYPVPYTHLHGAVCGLAGGLGVLVGNKVAQRGILFLTHRAFQACRRERRGPRQGRRPRHGDVYKRQGTCA